jgi:sugar O-acyltransferase (sialic acid O-acetyltransferase NeuD family)
MIIVGAGGFAKEMLDIVMQLNAEKDLAFYDDQNPACPDLIYDRFPVLRNPEAANNYFRKYENKFCVGVGNPANRKLLTEKFITLGGIPATLISPKSVIGHFGITIKLGSFISSQVVIENDVTIGEGCLINLNSTITHDCIIGDYSEISPGVHLSGKTILGEQCFVGTGAVTIPGVVIGDRCIIGAGAVIIGNVPSEMKVAGVPAKPLN